MYVQHCELLWLLHVGVWVNMVYNIVITVHTCPREKAAVIAATPQLAGASCHGAQQGLHAGPVMAACSDRIACGAPDLHLQAVDSASAPGTHHRDDDDDCPAARCDDCMQEQEQ